MDKTIDWVSKACHQCSALQQTPTARIEQSSCSPPETVGTLFAADVIKRSKQLILVVRECVTSFTATSILENECRDTLRDALICLCIHLRPLDGPLAVVRTDPAPGFKALTEDQLLKQHRISIELGRAKHCNKNPVAEKAVQEVISELLRHDPLGGPVSQVTLAAATANLNSRIRSRGLSAREMWTQRDQFSNQQMPFEDHDMIVKQNQQRVANHPHSEKSKAPTAKFRTPQHIVVGDLVYLHSDRNKTRARDRYLVVEIDGLFCNIKKFVGSQLRNASYRVKTAECYRVPSEFVDTPITQNDEDSSGDEVVEDRQDTQTPSQVTPSSVPAIPTPPTPPIIPTAISAPLSQCGPGDNEGDSDTELYSSEEQSQTKPSSDGYEPDQDAPLRRSTRERRPPERFGDFVMN